MSFEVTGFRYFQGRLGVLVYSNAKGFPTRPELAALRLWVEPLGESTVFRLDWPAGSEMAVAVFHDENGDQVFNRNFLGIPLEAIGMSGGRTNRFEFPNYMKSRIVAGARPASHPIHLFYLFGK